MELKDEIFCSIIYYFFWGLAFGILKKGEFGNITLPQLFKVNDWIIVIPAVVVIFLLLLCLERAGLE